jgi:hypothetical protein
LRSITEVGVLDVLILRMVSVAALADDIEADFVFSGGLFFALINDIYVRH